MSPQQPPHLVEEEDPLPSDGEGDRSQMEAKDDVALLVSCCLSGRTVIDGCANGVVENHGL